MDRRYRQTRTWWCGVERPAGPFVVGSPRANHGVELYLAAYSFDGLSFWAFSAMDVLEMARQRETTTIVDALGRLREQIRISLALDETIIKVLQRQQQSIAVIDPEKLHLIVLKTSEEILNLNPVFSRFYFGDNFIADRVEKLLLGTLVVCDNDCSNCECDTCVRRRLLQMVEPDALQNDLSRAILGETALGVG